MTALMNNVAKKLCKLTSVSIICVAAQANAHDLNMWPSKFNISSDTPTTVTIDLTFSEAAFRLDHATSPTAFSVLDPEGKKMRRTGNSYKSAERTTIDLPIDQQGTYTLLYKNPARYMTSYTAGKDDKKKRLRLDKQAAKSELPNSAKNVFTKKNVTSGISFVTNTLPSDKPFKIKNKDLEITPITHPSDYVTNETIAIKVTYNGKALKNTLVTLKRDGAQYTSNSTPSEATTDKNGELNFVFEQGGRYLLNINHSEKVKTNLYDELGYRLFYAFEVTYE